MYKYKYTMSFKTNLSTPSLRSCKLAKENFVVLQTHNYKYKSAQFFIIIISFILL